MNEITSEQLLTLYNSLTPAQKDTVIQLCKTILHNHEQEIENNSGANICMKCGKRVHTIQQLIEHWDKKECRDIIESRRDAMPRV